MTPYQNKPVDIFGTALLDYLKHGKSQDIIVHSSLTEDDEIPVSYLFRDYQDMPQIEQKALDAARGKVLDIGCGAGSHSLYLQKQGLEVTALDSSPGSVNVAKKRGVKDAVCSTLLDFKEARYDTILLLMNGTGIFERLASVDLYLQHLLQLLNPGGQILIDSSDLVYMFEEEDGSIFIDANQYYGEVTFSLSYKKQTSNDFDWLYMDYELLSQYAVKNGLQTELITTGDNFDFLAKLQKN